MKGYSRVKSSLGVSAVLTAALFLLPLAMAMPEAPLPQETAPPYQPEPFVSGVRDGERLLRVKRGQTVEQMDLGTYLVGVLRAEMPAGFEMEALKAQSVAARTYTLYHMENTSAHDDADICTDHTCCQAYLTAEEAGESWGADAAHYEEKVRRAVQQTDGEVILYGGEPILAVFHAASAGLTRPAGEVWVSDLPYLQAVESPEAAGEIPNYYSRVEISAADFRQKVLAACPGADLSGPPAQWLSGAVTDSAGSVDTVSVGGVTVKGTQVRSMFALRSACFTWEAGEKGVTFFVTGYGHGVGLSQYGANAMAQQGSDYKTILTHYYSGVEIAQQSSTD